jgi:MoaA/NifB/PqqE/SkfB family radical SAM enzyme
MASGPEVLSLADDNVCNLQCPSCRPHRAQALFSPANYTRLRKTVAAVSRDLKLLSLAHLGDPFASPTYRLFLHEFDISSYPDMQLYLATNGLLMPEVWPTLPQWHARLLAVAMSIDAATKATYEKLRLGGKWESLLAALAYIPGKTKLFRINFVVQADNFREMPDFVDLGLRIGATEILFTTIENWTAADDLFRQKNVMSPSHPDHNELVKVLADQRLHHPLVNRLVVDLAMRNGTAT